MLVTLVVQILLDLVDHLLLEALEVLLSLVVLLLHVQLKVVMEEIILLVSLDHMLVDVEWVVDGMVVTLNKI